MAFDKELFAAKVNKYIVELLMPVLHNAVVTSCETGSGLLWGYIAALVTEGVERNVYSVYKPKMYKRRGPNSGLADPNNVHIEVSELGEDMHCSFDVTNTTGPGPIYSGTGKNARTIHGGSGYIEDDVISGTGYLFEPFRSTKMPRDFYQVYNEQYDAKKAGDLVASTISDDEIVSVIQQAIMMAMNDIK